MDQDEDKHRRLKTIMSDRPDLIVSEMGGVAFSSVDQCFRAVDIMRMFETTIPIEMRWDSVIYVCVDPCAGGEHSDFAVVSFVFTNGIYQVYIICMFVRYGHRRSAFCILCKCDQLFEFPKLRLERYGIVVYKKRVEKVFLGYGYKNTDSSMRIERGKRYTLS